MANESAKIDVNQQKTLIGVTNAATPEIRNIKVDATTGRLLCSATVTGVSLAFLDLTDTPANYTSAASKTLKVNAGGTAIEFVTVAAAGDVSGPATNTADYLPQWDGADSKTLKNGLATSTFATAAQTFYIGTTQVAINRASSALSLAGVDIDGNSGTVTNATLTTALTVNTGTLTLTANNANSSVLTIGAGASSVSGSNTGDNSANSSTMYIGTTAVALNRGTAALTLAGITLTTPDIGTPNAGVLTSCTGLPVAGIADGTDGQLITWGTDAKATTVATGDADQVLTSNGADTAPTFQDASGGSTDPKTVHEVWDDFDRPLAETIEKGWTKYEISGTNTFGMVEVNTSSYDANAFGVVYISHESTDNAGAAIGHTNNGTGIYDGFIRGLDICNWTIEARIKLVRTTDIACFVGFVNGLDNSPFGTVRKVGMLLDTDVTANWRGVMRDSSDDFTSSSLAPSTSWITIKIVRNSDGTETEFFIDGASIGTLDNTELPAAGRYAVLEFATLTRSASGSQIFVDYIHYTRTGITR